MAPLGNRKDTSFRSPGDGGRWCRRSPLTPLHALISGTGARGTTRVQEVNMERLAVGAAAVCLVGSSGLCGCAAPAPTEAEGNTTSDLNSGGPTVSAEDATKDAPAAKTTRRAAKKAKCCKATPGQVCGNVPVCRAAAKAKTPAKKKRKPTTGTAGCGSCGCGSCGCGSCGCGSCGCGSCGCGSCGCGSCGCGSCGCGSCGCGGCGCGFHDGSDHGHKH